MNNEELNEIRTMLQVIGEHLADQKVATITLMAHQQAHLAAYRKLMEELGHSRQSIHQSLDNAYHLALVRYERQLRAFHESGDIWAFLKRPLFEDGGPSPHGLQNQ